MLPENMWINIGTAKEGLGLDLKEMVYDHALSLGFKGGDFRQDLKKYCQLCFYTNTFGANSYIATGRGEEVSIVDFLSKKKAVEELKYSGMTIKAFKDTKELKIETDDNYSYKLPFEETLAFLNTLLNTNIDQLKVEQIKIGCSNFTITQIQEIANLIKNNQ